MRLTKSPSLVSYDIMITALINCATDYYFYYYYNYYYYKKRGGRRKKRIKEKKEDHVAAPMKLLEKDRFLDRTIPELMSTDSATPTQTRTTHTNTSGARLPAVSGPLSIILRIYYSMLTVIHFSFCTMCLFRQFTCVLFRYWLCCA